MIPRRERTWLFGCSIINSQTPLNVVVCFPQNIKKYQCLGCLSQISIFFNKKLFVGRGRGGGVLNRVTSEVGSPAFMNCTFLQKQDSFSDWCKISSHRQFWKLLRNCPCGSTILGKADFLYHTNEITQQLEHIVWAGARWERGKMQNTMLQWVSSCALVLQWNWR